MQLNHFFFSNNTIVWNIINKKDIKVPSMNFYIKKKKKIDNIFQNGIENLKKTTSAFTYTQYFFSRWKKFCF